MREMTFDYRMELAFDQPVSRHRFTVKAFPAVNEVQQVLSLETEILPEAGLMHGTDSFGNRCVCGFAEAAHDRFVVHVSGEVRTGMADSLPAAPEWQLGPYRCASGLTGAGEGLRSAADLMKPEKDALRLAWQIMDMLHARFSYAPGVTGVQTTAEEAWTRRAGVCQDYAHIMLALLRLHHIPCRYAAGLMAGEGASHAWVDVACGGRWIALDPTNHRAVDGGYIRFGTGRDADDCAINRGVFTGFAVQTSTISAVVCDRANA